MRGIPYELARIIEAQYERATKPIRPMRRSYSAPIGAYTQTVRTDIPAGTGYATISAGGTATVQVGPQGIGTVWYPAVANIATSTGANDVSTCQLYYGPLSQLSAVSGTSYAGGGDSIGLSVPPLRPGYFIVAVWTGGTSGALASLQVLGSQDVLATY